MIIHSYFENMKQLCSSPCKNIVPIVLFFAIGMTFVGKKKEKKKRIAIWKKEKQHIVQSWFFLFAMLQFVFLQSQALPSADFKLWTSIERLLHKFPPLSSLQFLRLFKKSPTLAMKSMMSRAYSLKTKLRLFLFFL